MEGSDTYQIVRELCELFDRQMQVLRQHKLDDLSETELLEYENRKARIAELRVELGKRAKPM
jgi:hypothetical protein